MLAGKTMDVVEVGTVGGTMISGAAKGESTPEKEFLPNLQRRPTHQQYPIVNSNPITTMICLLTSSIDEKIMSEVVRGAAFIIFIIWEK